MFMRHPPSLAMAMDQNQPALARPSLYSTIRLAHLIQFIKNRLKSLIQHHNDSPRPTPCIKSRRQSLQAVNETIMSHSCSELTDPRRRRRGSKQLLTSELGCTDLLHNLDSRTPLGDLSLCKNAAQDSLFLRHNFRQVYNAKRIVPLTRVLDLTSALLKRMKCLRRSFLTEGEESHLSFGLTFDDIVSDRFYANLEHLLRCLQQIALDAILCLCLSLSLQDLFRWSHHQQIANAWFAEWPNALHPLNTTWPWNVKTALLVLWGVCWMFYAHGGVLAPFDHAEHYGQDFRTRQNPPPTPTPTSQQVTPTTALDSARILPSVSWLQPVQTSILPRRANNEGNAEHVYHASQSLYPTGASTYPYISPSPYVSSDIFPAATVPAWPYVPGSNPPSINVNTAVSNLWQPVANRSINFSETPQSIESFSPATPYELSRSKREYQTPLHLQTSTASQPAGSTLDHLGLHLPQGLSTNMQNYPSPQYSDVSGPTFTAHQKMAQGTLVSPSPVVLASPSIAESSLSHPSSHKSVEPTRNAAGILFCNHPEHGSKPPTFTRKCEWSKHMDKHTRPYTCEEPGCENRGFTYSGGLHRHQREVHNQHGGPKARCMCPYADCKRSTGQGFSRRENLMEHIRRVHVVPAEKVKSQTEEHQQTPPTQVSSEGRKRKRRAEDVVEEEGVDEGADQPSDRGAQSEESLKQEVKRLKLELQRKDERLRELEELIEQIDRAAKVQRKL